MRVLAVAFALALATVASTGSALAQEEERSLVQSDVFTYDSGAIESARDGWPVCTSQQWDIAANHCYQYHSRGWMSCNLISCTASGGKIAYSWSGYRDWMW
jgi:hypothetical protein